MKSPKTAYDYSIRLLSKRDYSQHKLKTKLAQRGFEEEDIDAAIAELISKKWLREEEYLRMRVKTLLMNGHGNKVIQLRLAQEKLTAEEDLIESLRSEFDLSSGQVVEGLIAKKMRGKKISSDTSAQSKLKTKMLSFLISKGHEYEEVKPKVDRYFYENRDS